MGSLQNLARSQPGPGQESAIGGPGLGNVIRHVIRNVIRNVLGEPGTGPRGSPGPPHTNSIWEPEHGR